MLYKEAKCCKYQCVGHGHALLPPHPDKERQKERQKDIKNERHKNNGQKNEITDLRTAKRPTEIEKAHSVQEEGANNRKTRRKKETTN